MHKGEKREMEGPSDPSLHIYIQQCRCLDGSYNIFSGEWALTLSRTQGLANHPVSREIHTPF